MVPSRLDSTGGAETSQAVPRGTCRPPRRAGGLRTIKNSLISLGTRPLQMLEKSQQREGSVLHFKRKPWSTVWRRKGTQTQAVSLDNNMSLKKNKCKTLFLKFGGGQEGMRERRLGEVRLGEEGGCGRGGRCGRRLLFSRRGLGSLKSVSAGNENRSPAPEPGSLWP